MRRNFSGGRTRPGIKDARPTGVLSARRRLKFWYFGRICFDHIVQKVNERLIGAKGRGVDVGAFCNELCAKTHNRFICNTPLRKDFWRKQGDDIHQAVYAVRSAHSAHSESDITVRRDRLLLLA